ncbi:uncharacterized protein LOC124291290 [Haliotis rubra]|uniref:uncharacterized protein LOC124291290 n=1 Tax=Haliotis rubra TaxID=36100 RepID=UPI001EE59D6E|nr:uncharacterized protein LOC124291290 [Haliotis rubra]
MKALARRGIGIQKRKADVLTRSQEEILWEMGILGEDTPQKLPANCSPFYLRPLKYQRPDVWYCASPIGRQTLGGTVRRLCGAAGFEGYYTNHSLRATTATRLYESGLDEQLIAERTGHRSSAIRGYKRTSEEMLQVVDDVVQGKVSNNVDTRPLAPKFFVASSSPSTSVTAKRFQTLPNIGAVSTAGGSAESTVANVSNAPISFTVERSGAKVTFQM